MYKNYENSIFDSKLYEYIILMHIIIMWLFKIQKKTLNDQFTSIYIVC